jgi:hypothetical protein
MPCCRAILFIAKGLCVTHHFSLKMSNKTAPSNANIPAVQKNLGDSVNIGAVSGSQHNSSSSSKPFSSFDKSVAKAVGGKLKLKTSANNSGIQ